MGNSARTSSKQHLTDCIVILSVIVIFILGFFLFSVFAFGMDKNEMLFAYVYSNDPNKVPSSIDEQWMIGKSAAEINERYEFEDLIILRYHHDLYYVAVAPVYEDGKCVRTIHY